MKKLIIAALVAGQLAIAAQPVAAAELTEARAPQMGAFAGLRLRAPLDGQIQHRQVRTGLTLAPTMHSRAMNGESRMRMGEGLELGLAGDTPFRLTFGGTPVSQLAQGPVGPDGRRMAVSTLGWIAIGVGAVVVLAVGAFALCMEDSECNPSE